MRTDRLDIRQTGQTARCLSGQLDSWGCSPNVNLGKWRGFSSPHGSNRIHLFVRNKRSLFRTLPSSVLRLLCLVREMPDSTLRPS